jgi:hypothetical protein
MLVCILDIIEEICDCIIAMDSIWVCITLREADVAAWCC